MALHHYIREARYDGASDSHLLYPESLNFLQDHWPTGISPLVPQPLAIEVV